ncbi:MAG TPA: TIGR04295 family B12-binding domain-containing radical SAM protein [Terriglobales bacterium]|nr:TIGR04295 family B12-binding domain-containing radical SAM protein [Terriglobales bacterium]
MRFALIQPRWEFGGSTYFGCPDTHMPLELLWARQQLEAAGHEALIVDAHLEGLAVGDAARRVGAFTPEVVVLTTAPTYLFWRCPQPELRVPGAWMRSLRAALPARVTTVAIGPHGSATPAAVLRKLGCDLVIQGEADQVLPEVVGNWSGLAGCAYREGGEIRVNPGVNQADLRGLAALDWSGYPLERRRHRHHVFSGGGRGAEVEATRGCPWACTFCNKTLFRNRFRERRVEAVLAEAEELARQGFTYVYFIDEIFGCGRQTAELLDGLEQLPLQFGMQTRIDLWDEASLAALGRAGCISMECGIESVSTEGRERFRKGCRLPAGRLRALLAAARRVVPWVQANLIAADDDDVAAVQSWRQELIAEGVWVSQPVPVFAYPGTPLYLRLFGPPDERAWERAHAHYLEVNRGRGRYSDIQDPEPAALEALESAA